MNTQILLNLISQSPSLITGLIWFFVPLQPTRNTAIVDEARKAADLLKSRFFKPDVYTSYKAASNWVRFAFWWPNIVTSLDSLSLMGYSRDDPDIRKALNWLVENQLSNGLWNTTYVEGKREGLCPNEKTRERQLWLTLTIARIFKRFYR